MEYGTVCLRRGEEKDLLAGGLWIYDNEIDWADDVCTDGDVVDVVDSRMRFVARGYFNSRSKIAVRVLTRDREYVKQPESFRHLYHRQMRKYPKMIEALDRRHEVYNETRRYVDQLEKEGTALVVAPSMPLSVSRFEKNKENLNQVYRLGHMDAENKWRAIEAWAKARQADCPHT